MRYLVRQIELRVSILSSYCILSNNFFFANILFSNEMTRIFDNLIRFAGVHKKTMIILLRNVRKHLHSQRRRIMQIKEYKQQTFFDKKFPIQMGQSYHSTGGRFHSLIKLATTHFSLYRIRREQTMKVEKLLSSGLSWVCDASTKQWQQFAFLCLNKSCCQVAVKRLISINSLH